MGPYLSTPPPRSAPRLDPAGHPHPPAGRGRVAAAGPRAPRGDPGKGRRRHDPILIALAKRLTTESAQFRHLAAHADALAWQLKRGRFPARGTDLARYRTACLPMGEAPAAHAAARGRIALRRTAADKK